MTTVAQALGAARQHIPAAEASLLLAEACGRNRAWLAAHDTDELPEDATQRFDDWVARRADGEPVAYILGWKEFYGRRFDVGPGVLIPRPETELLVEHGLAILRQKTAPRILDLGTGSGCIAISLSLERPDAEVWATDFSKAALNIASINGDTLGASVNFQRSDWERGLPELKFDLIVSNPPYIAPGDPHLDQGDLRFEPQAALTAADGGMAALRRIVTAAPGLLKPGGWLLCEHGYDQAEAMRELLLNAGFQPCQHADLAGIPRVSGGCHAQAATTATASGSSS